MRKQDYKGRCEKRQLSKCEGVFKSYDALQTKYALMLEDNEEVIEIKGKTCMYMWIVMMGYRCAKEK